MSISPALSAEHTTQPNSGELEALASASSRRASASATSLRKAVDTLAIVPTRDKISVLARKIYNVMMHHAQVQGVEASIYQVRLRDIVTGIDFNSNNTEILKEHLRQMVTTKVEWQSPTKGEGARWAVSALISHAELSHRAGEVILEWSYAPNIKQAILDPQRYARISLAFQAALKSMGALVLYEICCRYVDNPGGLTARQHWTWWRPVLTGVPEGQGSAYSEWKYFKRDVVKTAIAEINAVTELSIEAVEHKQGRAMTDLQFRVRRKSAAQRIPLAGITPVNLKEVGRAIKAGVSQESAEKLLNKHGENAFTAAVDQLEARLERRDLEPVRVPSKFLQTILLNPQQTETLSSAPSVFAAKEDKAKRIALIESYRHEQRAEAQRLFNEMPAAEQGLLVSSFETGVLRTSNPAVQRTYRSRALDSPLTKMLFQRYLADRLFGAGWDSPTDDLLLTYSLRLT